MVITIKKLIKLIQDADYLTNAQKSEWLDAIRYLSKEEITELAYIIANAEIEKRNFQIEQDMASGLLAQIFAEFNKQNENQDKKEEFIKIKKKEKLTEKKKINDILKKLKNV